MINILSKSQEKRPCRGKFWNFFSYTLKTTFLNGKFNLRMDTIRAFFSQNQGTFFDFQKRAGEVSPASCKPECFPYVSCICDTFWWVGIVTEVNVHEGDLKIEFLHPHGPRKTFSWPSVADKCFVPASNILCVITAPTTITGRMYRISDIDFEQTLKAYENHKM